MSFSPLTHQNSIRLRVCTYETEFFFLDHNETEVDVLKMPRESLMASQTRRTLVLPSFVAFHSQPQKCPSFL